MLWSVNIRSFPTAIRGYQLYLFLPADCWRAHDSVVVCCLALKCSSAQPQ